MQTTSLSASPASLSMPALPARDSYAVVLATGPDDGGKRATLAFAAACTAQAMELDTIVFMLGDGAHWAYDGHAEQVHAPGFPALSDLIDWFVEAGGQLLLCSACDAMCAVPARRRREVRIKGLASLLSHAVGGNSVTF
jgi:predicted peroxiredoxin